MAPQMPILTVDSCGRVAEVAAPKRIAIRD